MGERQTLREPALVRSARQLRQRAKMPALEREAWSKSAVSVVAIEPDDLVALRQTAERAALEVGLLRAELYSARVEVAATRQMTTVTSVVFLSVACVALAAALLALFIVTR